MIKAISGGKKGHQRKTVSILLSGLYVYIR